ncbi:immunoglobulin-like and fibronectin type III domain-containing protein 1 [Conger conger]|uniref:immunoglobulin-like and fibronectin type III domain-containing protein 1 n=1 Tax=Conger conger TaxID=82655 RepID=UPI002A5A5C4E|nr:immunoglobulin-like and fibronectin type III domain-containing protein 1 [Conger conger]
MFKQSKLTDQTATGQVVVKKKRSRVPGVMISQYVEELPEGKTTPDFTRKPIALTIQEGKLAIFKAIVTGEPTPTVSWARNKGDVSDPTKYQTKYDPQSSEHTIEMTCVSPEQADTYKCFATNEFGKAVVTAVLNVIEVGYKKNKELKEKVMNEEVKPVLKRRRVKLPKPDEKAGAGPVLDEKFWELLLSADKKDYERICQEYGVTNFRWMLKQLKEMKKEREEEQAQMMPSVVVKKKRSRVPGVMISQYVEELPEGKTTPDFTRKPIALTIQEGKLAIFKAIVTGEPTPTVSWARNKGDVSDPTKYQTKYDPQSSEHTIEMTCVSPEQADTYKCFATNEFGKAVVTAVLNVIEVGYKKNKELKEKECSQPDLLSFFPSVKLPKPDEKAGAGPVLDEKFWELLLSADKKDYERICQEYGVTNFRWMLKQLKEMKKEREEEQAQFVKHISNLKHVEIKGEGMALFELDMDLLDPSNRIFLYKDGEMVPYSKEQDKDAKHSLKQIGRKYIFTIKDLLPDDAGFYQVDVEGVNIMSTDFKIPIVDFIVKLQEVKAMEREDAIFECVLSRPFSKILWMGKNTPLEQGEKFDITVSEDKLIHRLVVKDCLPLDGGIYAAVAGIKSCSAWLIVEADNDPNLHGKKKVRKTTQAGGAGVDLAKIAQEQQMKLQKDKEGMSNASEEAQKQPIPEAVPVTNDDAGAQKSTGQNTDSGKNTGSGKDNGPAQYTGSGKDTGSGLNTGQDGSGSLVPEVQEDVGTPAPEPSTDKDGAVSSKVEDKMDADTVTESKLHFTSGLSDIQAVRGQPAELTCKLSKDCDGAWSKDGGKLSTSDKLSISKDGTDHTLRIHGCQDDDAGHYEFEAEGCKTEAKVVVGGPPEFDLDDLHKFSKPVVVRVGQNAAFKLAFSSQDALEAQWWKDGRELRDGGSVKLVKDSTHSRLLFRECLRSDSGEIRIQLSNQFGSVEAKTTLTVLDRPGPPKGPVEVVSTSSTQIEIKWGPPKDDGGSPVSSYLFERQQIGDSIWKKVGEVPADPLLFRDRNVSHGRRYRYRISALNTEGASEPLETEYLMAGTLVFPGAPDPPKVVSAFKNCINLSWTAPTETRGTKILGYTLEKRKKDTTQWISVNSVTEPIEEEKYAVKDVTEGTVYQFRVSAINISGIGDPSGPSELVCAKNPDMKPRFKDPEDFLVMRAGNSVRVKINYEASPLPDISWLKDGDPLPSWISMINTDTLSQLVIPASKRSDSGIYTIRAKNSVGQASFDVEVRVTDEPKPPGPIELEQIIHGKVIISWEASPDQTEDDRLYYVVAQHDSNTRVWKTVADRLFATSYTALNIMSGREYHFRVFAKNDIGLSDPSESPTWGMNCLKPSTAMASTATDLTLERPPSVLVPLKVHNHPSGYQCYMTCAVSGSPTPHVTWYLNNTSLESNNDYYMTNAYGVCSLYILRVSAKDSGEYKVVAVNSFGKAECTTKLTVQD